MKILLVNSRYAPYSVGGADISTRKLAVELARQGQNVEILTCNDVDQDDCVDDILIHRRRFNNIDSWFNYTALNPIRKTIYKALDYYNPFNRNELKKLLLEIAPDIIHTNNINGISPVIWSTAKKLGIPIVHTCRDYFLLCHKTTLVKGNGKPCNKLHFLCKIYRCFYRKISKNVSTVTSPSKYTSSCFVKDGYFKTSNEVVIYNAIDFDINETNDILEKRKRKTKSKIRFIYLGALESHKGVDLLMDAFKQIENPNIELLLAGKGSLEETIVCCTHEDNRIQYLGFLKEKELNEYLEKSDVLICPSNWPEPFGRVILDAYKHAMPVIATKIGGIAEIVNSNTGIQITAGSAEAIRKAIEIMASLEQRAYIDLCTGARDFLCQFSVKHQAEQFVCEYQKLI